MVCKLPDFSSEACHEVRIPLCQTICIANAGHKGRKHDSTAALSQRSTILLPKKYWRPPRTLNMVCKSARSFDTKKTFRYVQRSPSPADTRSSSLCESIYIITKKPSLRSYVRTKHQQTVRDRMRRSTRARSSPWSIVARRLACSLGNALATLLLMDDASRNNTFAGWACKHM